MKCIGRDCVYNKCNAGNYCNLPDDFSFTKEGENCIIDEEIESALEELNDIKSSYERLLVEKEKIINKQKI